MNKQEIEKQKEIADIREQAYWKSRKEREYKRAKQQHPFEYIFILLIFGIWKAICGIFTFVLAVVIPWCNKKIKDAYRNHRTQRIQQNRQYAINHPREARKQRQRMNNTFFS